MKALAEHWLQQLPPLPGVFACGVRHGDKWSVSRSWSEAFAPDALENAWRCLADAFQVLKLHRLPADRVRWVYERALLYGERRADGLCLGIFTSRDPQALDAADLARLVEEFHALNSPA